jgi:predicted RNase H-like HicB family nuclease
MEYHVFVEQHANNGYVAEVIGLPDCQAIGKTEEEAISKAKETLAARLTHGKIVTINLEPEITSAEHPMWKGFGRLKDDPTFDDLMERIAEYRRELDEEEAAR